MAVAGSSFTRPVPVGVTQVHFENEQSGSHCTFATRKKIKQLIANVKAYGCGGCQLRDRNQSYKRPIRLDVRTVPHKIASTCSRPCS